jgi:hypothetical protein
MKVLSGLARFFGLALACLGAAVANAGDPAENSAAALRAEYGALQDQLSHNPFQKPLHLDSSETPGNVTGDIHARLGYPFATVGAALNSPYNWCDILILHLNTKYCRASTAQPESILKVRIGKKHNQPLDEAYLVEFAYRVAAQTPTYLQVNLNADAGPLSTRNYRIMIEAVPLEGGQTFIHLS